MLCALRRFGAPNPLAISSEQYPTTGPVSHWLWFSFLLATLRTETRLASKSECIIGMHYGVAMNTLSTSTVILAIVLIAAAAVVVAWALFWQRNRQSERLQRRFGPEYSRTVKELGGRTQGEAELRRREARVARLHITALAPADAARFTQAWNNLQGRFIDNPKGVVAEADLLVRELMTKRGYPMGDFERLASDISVDHPAVVSTYRAAQIIAARDARGEADTEELRKAVVHYRTLFDELLEADSARSIDSSHNRVPVHS